jgi:hypothetical protein
MLLIIIVVSWTVFVIWRRCKLAPKLHPPFLAFVCKPTDDENITCLFCGLTGVELEYTYRTNAATVTAGVHQDCLDNPRHCAVSSEDIRHLVS